MWFDYTLCYCFGHTKFFLLLNVLFDIGVFFFQAEAGIRGVTGVKTFALRTWPRRPNPTGRQQGRRRHTGNPRSPEKGLSIERKRDGEGKRGEVGGRGKKKKKKKEKKKIRKEKTRKKKRNKKKEKKRTEKKET